MKGVALQARALRVRPAFRFDVVNAGAPRLVAALLLASTAACGGGGSQTSTTTAAMVSPNTPATPTPTTVESIVATVTSGAGAVAETVETVVGTVATAAGNMVDAVAETVGSVTTTVSETVGETASAVTDPSPTDPASGQQTPASSPPPATPPSDVLDVLLTRSGHWRVVGLPSQGDAAVYRMTLDENPAFVREFACRPIFTKEAGKGTALDLLTVTLLDQPATVAQGACRVVQNLEPVAPNADWLREAVAAHVIPAYSRVSAWLPKLPALARDPRRGAYDATSLGPRTDGASSAPSSNHNFIGVTSAQGGEYSASRGFLHDADARVVDAALHNEDAAIAAFWGEFTQYTRYSLAQPQGAAWSATNHTTIDPQFPQDGDRGYELPFHNSPNPAIDSMADVAGWTRNVAHLEDTGFVHWLATEDPIAGLLVQRQAAYALAGRQEYLRGGYAGSTVAADTAYEGMTDEERALFNTLSALWKSRDVSRRVVSANGRLIWSQVRAERQASDVIAFYDRIAQRIELSTPARPADYLAKLSGTLFGAVIGIGSYAYADGTTVKLQQTSAFQAVQYGKEPLYLWTRAGNPAVRRWFTSYATGLAMRMAVIGGAMGVDGRTSNGGSGYPIGPTAVVNGTTVAAAPNFATPRGWAEWVASLPLRQVDARTSFDGASVHTAMQMEGALLMARDVGLPIPELDTAIAQVRTAKAATTALRYTTLQMHKHLGAPAQ